MSSRLGVLGGMFDPVHSGHIEAARFAIDKLDLDQVQLIPCHIPNHKDSANCSSLDRLAMLELAIGDQPRMRVNSVEIIRATVSYTIDTLIELQESAADSSLVFVLGMDAFNSLPQWHRWQEILAHCHLFVLPRDAEAVLLATATAVSLELRQVYTAQEMFAKKSGNIWIADDFHCDLSSTQVREKLRQREDLNGDLDCQVLQYINQHKLYGHD